MADFFKTYFIDPIYYNTGYNIFNTAVFAIILIAAALLTYKLLKAMNVKIDKKYKRPNEVPFLLGDASKIKKIGWKPKMKFNEIVRAMVDYDLAHPNDN